MKKIKRPSTIKMKRLLMHFIECDAKDRATLRELQEDARRVIYFDEDLQPGQRKTAPAARKARKAAEPKPARKASKAAKRKPARRPATRKSKRRR